jgi:hypothetical protein
MGKKKTNHVAKLGKHLAHAQKYYNKAFSREDRKKMNMMARGAYETGKAGAIGAATSAGGPIGGIAASTLIGAAENSVKSRIRN